MNFHRPFGNPGDRFGDPQPWHRNLDSEYGQFRGQSQIGETGMISGGYNDGFAPSRFDHGGAGFKRMRVDEMGMGSIVDEKRLNSSISMDDERRLKLIRDHGGVSSGAAQGRANWAGMGVDVNREATGYLQESSNFDMTPGGIDNGVVRGRLDDLRSGRNDMTFKQPTNYEIDDFRDPTFSDFNRKGTSFCPEPDFSTHNHGKEHGLAFSQQNLQSYKDDELWKSQYGEGENSSHQSLPTNGHTGLLAGRNSSLGDSYSQSAPHISSEILNENYYHQSYSLSAKEPQYSHPTGWHGMSASSVTPHEQSSFTRENRDPNYQPPQPYTMKNAMQLNHDTYFRGQLKDRMQSYEVNVPSQDSNKGPVGHQIAPKASQFGPQHFDKQGSYVPAGNGTISESMTPIQASRVFNVQPPLPASPPPPLPGDPPGHLSFDRPRALPSPAKPSSSLFPIAVSSAAAMASSYAAIPEPHSLARHYFHDKSHLHASTGLATEV